MTPNKVFFDMALEAEFLRTQRRLNGIMQRAAAHADDEHWGPFIEDAD